MTNSQQDPLFVEPQRSALPKALAALAAILITALVFSGYALLRKRHAQSTAALVTAGNEQQPRQPPKALILVDEALLQGGKTTIGGTVRNTSAEKLDGLSVELELKRRADGVAESKLLKLEPAELEPQQEGRYLLQVKTQDYGSARLVGLKGGPQFAALPYTTAPGQKRPLERLETKKVTVGKPAGKGGEFLNSPDNPARVP